MLQPLYLLDPLYANSVFHLQLITSIYYILSFSSCNNLVKSYKLLNIEISNEIWRAPVAATLLGGLLVLLFNILSCVILIRKSIDKRGPGFGYGFIVAMCFTVAFFVLLCGLVLDGFKDVVTSELEVKLSTAWSKYNTGEYVATIVFAYMCFVMFILFFFALVIFQSAVSEELGIGKLNRLASSVQVHVPVSTT
eukprot:jgi/Chrzof1/11972/Cz06g16170.t1